MGCEVTPSEPPTGFAPWSASLTDLGGSLLLIPIHIRKTIEQKGQITRSYRSQTNENLSNMDRTNTMKLQNLQKK